jgi:AcrR family transcriptional regulator
MYHTVSTADHILDAAEMLICRDSIDDISVRRISDIAGVSASAISYHFGSRDELLIEAIRVVYRRFNAERLLLLQTAIDRMTPAPADLHEVITALVGPSVRWSLDPQSSYRAFTNLTFLAQRSDDTLGTPRRRSEYIRPFISPLQRIAPWLSDGEVGFRVHAALGIRSAVIRDRARLAALTKSAFKLDDAQQVIGLMISVIAPMFAEKS